MFQLCFWKPEQDPDSDDNGAGDDSDGFGDEDESSGERPSAPIPVDDDDDDGDEKDGVSKESQEAQPVEPTDVHVDEEDDAGVMDEVVSQTPDVAEPEGHYLMLSLPEVDQPQSSTVITSSQILQDSQEPCSTNLLDGSSEVDTDPKDEDMNLGNKDLPSKGWVDLPDDPVVKIPELEKKLASLRRQHTAVLLVICYLFWMIYIYSVETFAA